MSAKEQQLTRCSAYNTLHPALPLDVEMLHVIFSILLQLLCSANMLKSTLQQRGHAWRCGAWARPALFCLPTKKRTLYLQCNMYEEDVART